MNERWNSYLVQLLRADLASKEAEVASLRSSLRYRLGGWLIEAWPLSRRTLVNIIRLLIVFSRFNGRNRGTRRETQAPNLRAIAGADTPVLIFGEQALGDYCRRSIFCSDDPVVLIQLLDKERPPGTLVVKLANEAIVRRLSRLRLNGWRVVWQPEGGINAIDAHLVAYLESHADECVGSTS